MTLRTPRGRKVSYAKKVMKTVLRQARPRRIRVKSWIAKIHREQAVHRTQLRTFGVPRAGTHVHRAQPKKPRTAAKHRSPRTYRKPKY